jgi:putative transposase
MPRQTRLDAPGALHHVMGRGIDRIKIFKSKVDRNDFLSRLADLCERGDMMRTARQPLSHNMRRLLTGYVVNFNRRHRRYGHLFQNRYKSIICEDDPYLLQLTRYIHLNPLRGDMVENLEELNEYPWSGHSAIMGKVKRGWQDIDTVLGYFGKRRKGAIERYEKFVNDGILDGRRPELVGGGLVRSLGGWSQVLSLRRKGDKVASDERILGSSEFVKGIISGAEQKEKETLRLSQNISDLSSLAKEIVKRQAISYGELRSGSRKKGLVKARKLFCQLAVKKMGYSGAEVARFLGVTTSAVNRSANSEEIPQLDQFL